jgi:glycosyltransferase 2 family protein
MNPQNNNQLNDSKISNFKVILRFVLTWLITIVIFAIIFSRIKLIDVIALIKQTQPVFFCAGILFSVVSHLLLSSMRYQKIVEVMGCRLSLSEAIVIRMGCNPIKGILPFRMGELAIAAYMKNKYNLSYARGLASISFGFIFSFIALAVFYSFGCIFYVNDRTQRMVLALLFLAILLVVTPLSIRYIRQLLAWIFKKIRKLPEESVSLIEQYDSRTTKIILLHSFGIEGFKLLIILILLKSLHINVPLATLLLFGSVTILAAYLPITYWGLGVRESAILILFSAYAPPDKLLAGSLLTTFVDSIFPSLLGLFFVKPFLNSLWGSEKEGIN